MTKILRNGACALLTQAVEAEVAEFLTRHADLKTGDVHRRIVRHGHLPEREIMTGVGPVAVRQPRVRDRETPRVSRAVRGFHDFNLNIPRYIDSSEPEDVQDIEAHLKGGIPVRDIDALQPYWNVLPSVRGGDRPGYCVPKIEPAAVKPAILGHAEFADYAAKLTEVFTGWRTAHLERLKDLNIGDHPKQLIGAISEDLLVRFAKVALIDKYDVYQLLMTYWAEAMQDDAYLIAQDGWAAARQIRELVRNNEGKFAKGRTYYGVLMDHDNDNGFSINWCLLLAV
jgi:hypothetical protein